jgi:hypothetical protein
MDTAWIDDYANLILNMSGGLLPEDLIEDEVILLIEKDGEDWFEKLGYSEPKYKKPVFTKR